MKNESTSKRQVNKNQNESENKIQLMNVVRLRSSFSRLNNLNSLFQVRKKRLERVMESEKNENDPQIEN